MPTVYNIGERLFFCIVLSVSFSATCGDYFFRRVRCSGNHYRADQFPHGMTRFLFGGVGHRFIGCLLTEQLHSDRSVFRA